jgi:hypothetical protein
MMRCLTRRSGLDALYGLANGLIYPTSGRVQPAHQLVGPRRLFCPLLLCVPKSLAVASPKANLHLFYGGLDGGFY